MRKKAFFITLIINICLILSINAQFDNSQDIGSPGRQGSTSEVNNTYTIKGGGNDIWSTSDKFHFTSGLISGDTEISCRVDSVQNTHLWAKAGLMFRESLSANSKNVLVFMRPDKKVTMQYRGTTGVRSYNLVSGSSTGDTVNAKWLKLVRSGNDFTGSYSVNGTDWIALKTVTVDMESEVELGLAVTSHNNNTLTTASISNVNVKSSLVEYSFESGDLGSWEITSGSFGKIVSDRAFFITAPSTPYNKDGDYYLTTLDKLDGGKTDAYTGTIESPDFTLNKSHIELKVGGGQANDVWVAVHLASTGEELYRTSGSRSEPLEDRIVDLSDYIGQDLFIRVVDNSTGGWGYIAVDHIRETDGPTAAPTAFSFETGDLGEWTITSGSFGKIVSDRAFFITAPSTPYNKDGDYYLTTLDKLDGGKTDAYTGTIQSPDFTLSKSHIELKVGGGQANDVWVAIHLASTGEELYRTSGSRSEPLEDRIVDLSAYIGEDLYFLVVDNSANGWGYIAVDNLRQTDGPAGNSDISVLVFSEVDGFVHDSITDGINAIKAMGAQSGWTVDTSGDASAFTVANLAKYDVIVWNNNCANSLFLTASEQAAFKAFIQAGGGFVGIHCASHIGNHWPWFYDMIGAVNTGHPSGALQFQQATINVESDTHQSTSHLGNNWLLTDEWFYFDQSPRASKNILLTLDETSYNPGNAMGDHPIAWYGEYDGGRMFYTGIGHREELFSNADYLAHLKGGIIYAAGASDVTQNGLIIDLNANLGVTVEDGDRVIKWLNQAPVSKGLVFEYKNRDHADFAPLSGRPGLQVADPDLKGNNTLTFYEDELICLEEDTFDYLSHGVGHTWFTVIEFSNHTRTMHADLNAFFGNLKNGSPFSGIWGGITNDFKPWYGLRNGVTGARDVPPNSSRLYASTAINKNKYYILSGRLEAGTGIREMELFINNTLVGTEDHDVKTTINPSVFAIGTERDAFKAHPGFESFDGKIGRFLMYDRPLSDAEMLEIHNTFQTKYFSK